MYKRQIYDCLKNYEYRREAISFSSSLCKTTILRYFLEFSYKGTAYHGWQRQPNAITVQETLEENIKTLLGVKTVITAAGRTDTGVHAKQMFAHIDLNYTINKPTKLIDRLNKFLPNDIAIIDIHLVNDNSHARFDAISRTYLYYIVTNKKPFNQDTAFSFFKPLDIDKMNDAAQLLLSHTNFKCFSKSKSDVKTYDCDITEAYWKQFDDELVFHISANRFLRNMVRAIVGTLVNVGIGKCSIDKFRIILNSQDRTQAGSSVPAQGLFLTQVQYPNTIFEKNG